MASLDEIFHEFAEAFRGKVKSPGREIAFPEMLDRERLDGSLESLEVVDRYLEFLHENRERATNASLESSVLWAGAYVGEVMRLSVADGALRWVDYDDYVPLHPDLQRVIPTRELATCALLVSSAGTMWMPLNKIVRYLQDGREQSVRHFANVVLNELRKS